METLINTLHLDDIKNPEHSSSFRSTNEYSLLITRLFTLQDNRLIGVSTPYIIFKDSSVWQYQRDEKTYLPLIETHRDIYDSIEKELENSEYLIMRYIEEIDKLEDDLYMRKLSPIFLDLWFDLKKDITRIERILERAHESLKKYAKFYADKEDFSKDDMVNTLEHLERYQRLSSLNSSKLDTLYSYYNSLKSDKMNNNVYALTVLSGIFLPLNLVVGFFGMNTENLFFHGQPSGTMNVVFMLGILFFLFIAILPLISLLERLILRRLLGRFNIYNNLVHNIKKMSLFKNE